ncbi:hypothetical protein [Butyrivibrio fibrisolvens]|uniref:hypothetical protein n=1 Tax=Butyrivibrio fibrisolvens TaxID=831 RepID=UPI0020C0655C|nr:hypothetical protein [Butyrivibrio fibrisolvens]
MSDESKNNPKKDLKSIKTKSNPKKDALANAPEQVLAMAIRDAMRKDKDKT